MVQLLNEDLETEHQSIVQYVHHIATVDGAGWHTFGDELRNHLAQELDHVRELDEALGN